MTATCARDASLRTDASARLAGTRNRTIPTPPPHSSRSKASCVVRVRSFLSFNDPWRIFFTFFIFMYSLYRWFRIVIIVVLCSNFYVINMYNECFVRNIWCFFSYNKKFPLTCLIHLFLAFTVDASSRIFLFPLYIFIAYLLLLFV